jgi:hypothetical protein
VRFKRTGCGFITREFTPLHKGRSVKIRENPVAHFRK